MFQIHSIDSQFKPSLAIPWLRSHSDRPPLNSNKVATCNKREQNCFKTLVIVTPLTPLVYRISSLPSAVQFELHKRQGCSGFTLNVKNY